MGERSCDDVGVGIEVVGPGVVPLGCNGAGFRVHVVLGGGGAVGVEPGAVEVEAKVGGSGDGLGAAFGHQDGFGRAVDGGFLEPEDEIAVDQIGVEVGVVGVDGVAVFALGIGVGGAYEEPWGFDVGLEEGEGAAVVRLFELAGVVVDLGLRGGFSGLRVGVVVIGEVEVYGQSRLFEVAEASGVFGGFFGTGEDGEDESGKDGDDRDDDEELDQSEPRQVTGWNLLAPTCDNHTYDDT